MSDVIHVCETMLEKMTMINLFKLGRPLMSVCLVSLMHEWSCNCLEISLKHGFLCIKHFNKRKITKFLDRNMPRVLVPHQKPMKYLKTFINKFQIQVNNRNKVIIIIIVGWETTQMCYWVWFILKCAHLPRLWWYINKKCLKKNYWQLWLEKNWKHLSI